MYQHHNALTNAVRHMILTNTGPSGDRGLADPERDPGENHQQNGGNIRLQDKEQHISAQCKMQHQLGVLSCEEAQKKILKTMCCICARQEVSPLLLHKGRGILGAEVSYLSHTQPLTLRCSSSLHCTGPTAVCLDLSLSHSLWSSRTPRPAGCSPLITHTFTITQLRFDEYNLLKTTLSLQLVVLTTLMMMVMMMIWMFDGGGEGEGLLTALQLQGAHLSVHGVLSQVHVAGNRSCDAVVNS